MQFLLNSGNRYLCPNLARGIYDTLRAIQSCLIEILAIVCVLLYMHILSQTQRLFFANLISKQTQPGSVFCLYETLP